jgi:SNF family Na+-dependent transporter
LRKEVFVLIITLLYFSLGLIFVTNNGYWNFTLFNNYAAGLSLVYVLVVETSMIAYYFGLDKLEVLIYKRTGERLPTFFKICIKYVSIPLIGLTFFIGLYNEFFEGGEDVRWTQVVARSLIFIPIAASFLGFFIKIDSKDMA